MKEYLLILTKEEQPALGAVRCLPNLRVAEDGHLYLRGIDEATMADTRMRNLPVLHSYLLDAEQRLFPLQGVTPVGKLKPLQWVPIAEFINIELPVSAMPGRLQKRLNIKLVPTKNSQDGCALMTNIDTWRAYAETAPAIRLEHLQFAATTNGDVIVTGHPLPAIPGKEYYSENDILLPSGFAFEVPVIAAILQQKLNVANDAILLFSASGEWHRVPRASFVKASRSAIRLTSVTN